MARQLDFIYGLKTKKCISSNVPDYTLRKWYHVKVLLTEEVHLNGHTIGFHPQTQKLKLHSTM